MNTDIFGPAMLGVTTGVQAFQGMLPRISDIRKADPTTHPEIAADVRMGEIAGVTLTMGIGIIASSLTSSAVPAFTALLMCLVLVTLYESTLRADRPFESKLPNLHVVPRESEA